MIWFVEAWSNIVYIFNTYFNIDITTFTDFQKVVVIIGVNIMVWVIVFIILYILKHVIYKLLTIIC